jgi:hypothetical protein
MVLRGNGGPPRRELHGYRPSRTGCSTGLQRVLSHDLPKRREPGRGTLLLRLKRLTRVQPMYRFADVRSLRR